MFVFIRYELNIVYTDDKKIITLFVIFMSIKKKMENQNCSILAAIVAVLYAYHIKMR